MFDIICDALHGEMKRLEEKYSGGAQMSDADLKDIDTMAHALKCIATYEAMKGEPVERVRRTRYTREPEYEYRRY